MSHAFWIHEPTRLISSPTVIPHRDMCHEELLNTITRLVIIIALILLLFRAKDWWVFLIGGLLLILFLWWMTPSLEPEDIHVRKEYYRCKNRRNNPIQTTPNIRPRYKR